MEKFCSLEVNETGNRIYIAVENRNIVYKYQIPLNKIEALYNVVLDDEFGFITTSGALYISSDTYYTDKVKDMKKLFLAHDVHTNTNEKIIEELYSLVDK